MECQPICIPNGYSNSVGEPKIFATKAPRHKGYINGSYFLPWCIGGRPVRRSMWRNEKSFVKTTQN